MGIDRIMLCGPMYAGKSTLARALWLKHGYYYINYSDALKLETIKALEVLGHSITLAEMKANKKKYRRLLQELGLVEFNTNPVHVGRALRGWLEAGKPKAVFDNVRMPLEYETLSALGFRLVKISIDPLVQLDRAQAAGVPYEEYLQAIQHPVENALSDHPEWVELALNGAHPIEITLRKLLGDKEETVGRTRMQGEYAL